MTARSVYWQDGMLMWPHHMQQEERFQAQRVRLHHQWNLHHNWGLRLLDVDNDALKAGRLVVRRLKARMRDGTLIEIPAEGRLAFLDINELLVGRDEVTIFLGLAKLHANRPNATMARGAGGRSAPEAAAEGANGATDARYLVETFEAEDENTGEDQQSLQFRILNVKLLPDSQDLAGFEILPIARFIKNAAGGPQVDVNYIPPLLACDAWKTLAVDILQVLFHHLGSRMDNLATKVSTRGISFESHNPGDAVVLGQLAVLNEASTVLNTIAFAEGIHPFPAYLELCRIVGQLAIYTRDHRVPKLPAYDHDDLGTCYYTVKRFLDEVEGGSVAYEEQPFIGEELRMQVTMEAKWLEPAWQMFVGVQSPLAQVEVIRLLTKPGQLDMKIGSGKRVDQLFERGIKGLEFTHTALPPRVLPAQTGLTYFQVNRDTQKTEWAEVQKCLTLAIRVNQSRVAVNPAGNIQGQQTLVLKQQGTQASTTMQFSLFLVPGQT